MGNSNDDSTADELDLDDGTPTVPVQDATSTSQLSLSDLVTAARERTWLLYDGKVVAHRSCGISLAETYGRRTEPYQALRKGGITGCGECGAIKAGELILGEILGDPDPTGAVTENLREALLMYRGLWKDRVDLGAAESNICNDITAQFDEFLSPERHRLCTRIAADASACVAEVLTRVGYMVDIGPAPER